jgi:hypothetical protein
MDPSTQQPRVSEAFEPEVQYTLAIFMTVSTLICLGLIWLLIRPGDSAHYPSWLLSVIRFVGGPLGKFSACVVIALAPLSVYRQIYYLLPLHAWYALGIILITPKIPSLFHLSAQGETVFVDLFFIVVIAISAIMSLIIIFATQIIQKKNSCSDHYV